MDHDISDYFVVDAVVFFYSAKYDFKEKINEYISSMIYLGDSFVYF